MREEGRDAPPVMYVPADEEDYYMRTGNLPKALAATAANADLAGIRVPHRQEDGRYLDDEGDEMTREDMADYFARLRAAQAAEAAAAQAAADGDEPPARVRVPVAAPASLRPPPPATRPRLTGRKAQARGAMRKTNVMKN